MDSTNGAHSGPAPDVPAAPAPGEAPAIDEATGLEIPVIELNFPPFNPLAARQGRLVRSPGDRLLDVAEIRDVHAASVYAAQCAAIAVQTVNDRMFVFYQNQLQVMANNTAIAIKLSIDEYDRQRRARVWYRRLQCWLIETLDAVVTELGIRSPTPSQRPATPMVTDPAVVGTIAPTLPPPVEAR